MQDKDQLAAKIEQDLERSARAFVALLDVRKVGVATVVAPITTTPAYRALKGAMHLSEFLAMSSAAVDDTAQIRTTLTDAAQADGAQALLAHGFHLVDVSKLGDTVGVPA